MPVVWFLPGSMIRCVHDIHNFRCNLANHHLDPLPQRYLGGSASLAASTHGDEQVSILDVDDRNLAAIEHFNNQRRQSAEQHEGCSDDEQYVIQQQECFT